MYKTITLGVMCLLLACSGVAILIGCGSVIYHNPNFVELISPMGAKPLPTLVAMDTNKVKNLHIYISYRSPAGFALKGVIDPGLQGWSFLLYEITSRKIKRQFIDPDLLNLLEDSLQRTIEPSVTVIKLEPLSIDGITIPLYSIDEPSGSLFLPPANKYKKDVDDEDTLLIFITLHTGFVDVWARKFAGHTIVEEVGAGYIVGEEIGPRSRRFIDFGVVDVEAPKLKTPPLYIAGTGTLAICSVEKWNKFTKKAPYVRKKMEQMTPQDYFPKYIWGTTEGDMISLYCPEAATRMKRVKELQKIIKESGCLDGFYVKTFEVARSSTFKDGEWLDWKSQRMEKELSEMIKEAVKVAAENLSYYFGKR